MEVKVGHRIQDLHQRLEKADSSASGFFFEFYFRNLIFEKQNRSPLDYRITKEDLHAFREDRVTILKRACIEEDDQKEQVPLKEYMHFQFELQINMSPLTHRAHKRIPIHIVLGESTIGEIFAQINHKLQSEQGVTVLMESMALSFDEKTIKEYGGNHEAVLTGEELNCFQRGRVAIITGYRGRHEYTHPFDRPATPPALIYTPQNPLIPEEGEQELELMRRWLKDLEKNPSNQGMRAI